MRENREQRWDQEKPRMKHEDLRQGKEGGMDQNHYIYDHINGSFIYSGTLVQKNLWSMKGVKVITKLITSHN